MGRDKYDINVLTSRFDRACFSTSRVLETEKKNKVNSKTITEKRQEQISRDVKSLTLVDDELLHAVFSAIGVS